jgi:hypothetical protein
VKNCITPPGIRKGITLIFNIYIFEHQAAYIETGFKQYLSCNMKLQLHDSDTLNPILKSNLCIGV